MLLKKKKKNTLKTVCYIFLKKKIIFIKVI